MNISCLVAEIFKETSGTWMIKKYVLPQHAFELGLSDEKTRIIKELP